MNGYSVIAAAIGLHNLTTVTDIHPFDAGFESITAIVVVSFNIDASPDDLLVAGRKIAVCE